MSNLGWVHQGAMNDDSVGTNELIDLNVTTPKIALQAITIDLIESTLLGYLLSVGRIDYSPIDYCKVS